MKIFQVFVTSVVALKRLTIMKSPVCLALAVAVVSTSCGQAHDEDFIPYDLTGMNAYVYDNQTSNNIFAGFSPATYDERDRAKQACYANAVQTARTNYIESWGYVCCTATPETSCHTKVR